MFRRLVVWCVTWRKTTIAITALAFVASMGAFTLAQKQFFPTANRPELIVDMGWRLVEATDKGTQAREVAG
jgi:multidrug efflux pump